MKRIEPEIEKIDNEKLLSLIRDDQECLGWVYKQSKSYCINFLRGKNYQLEEEELFDIYQDSVISFYERIKSDFDFKLTASVKTYLCSVGYYKLLKKTSGDFSKVNIEVVDYMMKSEGSESELVEKNEKQFNAIEKALEIIKEKGGNCFELLTQFWYHRKSMKELTELFDYTNEANTKNQKAKCQKRLKDLAYELLE